MGEVGDEPLLRVEHLRADRDGEDGVLAARAVREPAAAGAAAPGAKLLVRPEPGEVAPLRVGDEHDVAALAAVAAVGAALRHVLLAPEVDRPVAAAPGERCQSRLVVEHAPTVTASDNVSLG